MIQKGAHAGCTVACGLVLLDTVGQMNGWEDAGRQAGRLGIPGQPEVTPSTSLITASAAAWAAAAASAMAASRAASSAAISAGSAGCSSSR